VSGGRGLFHRDWDPERSPPSCCSSRLLSPEPRQRQHATDPIIPYHFPFSLHMGPPRSHRRGQKAVLPCMSHAFSPSEPTWLPLLMA
jgi:hypothetical protein